MNFNKTDKNAKLDTFVREYLRLEPAALASLSVENNGNEPTTEAGLHEFMRLVLERANHLLCVPEDRKVEVLSDTAARALGFPNARVFNLMQLFAYALVRQPRRRRERAELSLVMTEKSAVSARRDTSRDRLSIEALNRAAVVRFEPDFDAICGAARPGRQQELLVGELIRELLGVQPEHLIRPFHRTQLEADKAFARDPEAQTIAGLSAVLTRAVHNVPNIAGAGIDSIKFLVYNDQNCGLLADAANFSTLLLVGLLANGKRDIELCGLMRVNV